MHDNSNTGKRHKHIVILYDVGKFRGWQFWQLADDQNIMYTR